jgi:hypothetical protein
VLNSREEVHKAFDDYEAGRFGRIPGGVEQPAATAPKPRAPLAAVAAVTERLTQTPWTERKELLRRVLADRPADR